MSVRRFVLSVLTAFPWLFSAVAASASLYDSEIYSQIPLFDLNDGNRARYLADVRAAGVGTVLVSFGDFFKEGAARRPTMDKLAHELRFFETNGIPTIVWINGFGYGDERTGVAAKRLARSTRLTSFDGKTGGAVCPTDPVIRQALAENVRDAAKAGARCILMDDDFVQSVRPGLGCACSNHLSLVSKALGRTVTAADIRDSFAGRPNAVRTAFLDVSGKVATDLARELRRELDAIDPTIGMGLCASYTHYDLEGTDVKELLAAFAGKTRRFFRISGAPYWRDGKYAGAGLAGTLEFVRMQTSWLRGLGDLTVLDENDPYPRVASVVPPYLCELYDKATIADGVLRRHKYMLCYGARRQETGYLDAHLANQGDDDKLRALFEKSDAFGVRVIFPEHAVREAELPTPYAGDRRLMMLCTHPLAAHFLVKNGIPVCYGGRAPALVFGAAALSADAATVKNGVIADLPAAEILKAKGFSAASGRIEVLPIDGSAIDFAKYKAGSDRMRLLEAVRRLSGRDIPVCVESAGSVYQIVRRNHAEGTYAVLLENLGKDPVDVLIRTTERPCVVGSLRGSFVECDDGLELKALPPHAYAAVKFGLATSAAWTGTAAPGR